jgi:PAS domain S-box-containing protein
MPASATVDEDLRRMLSVIQEQYNQRFTLAALARTLGVRPTYLGQLFHKEFGMTVHEYVTRARMVFGATHVCSGVKIEAVALNLGYRSKKNFYRQFKRFFGMTPEAYRHDRAGSIIATPATKRRAVLDGPTGIAERTALSRGARRLSAERLAARILPGSPPALFITDEHGRYVAATTTAVALTGYSVDELRGMRAEVLFPHVSGSKTKNRLQLLRPALSSSQATAVLQTKDAGRIHVHLMSIENLLGTLASVRSPDRRTVVPQVSVRGLSVQEVS